MNLIKITVDGQLLIFNNEPDLMQVGYTLNPIHEVKIYISLGVLNVMSLLFFPIQIDIEGLEGDISLTLTQDVNYSNPDPVLKINKRSLWKKKN